MLNVSERYLILSICASPLNIKLNRLLSCLHRDQAVLIINQKKISLQLELIIDIKS